MIFSVFITAKMAIMQTLRIKNVYLATIHARLAFHQALKTVSLVMKITTYLFSRKTNYWINISSLDLVRKSALKVTPKLIAQKDAKSVNHTAKNVPGMKIKKKIYVINVYLDIS